VSAVRFLNACIAHATSTEKGVDYRSQLLRHLGVAGRQAREHVARHRAGAQGLRRPRVLRPLHRSLHKVVRWMLSGDVMPTMRPTPRKRRHYRSTALSASERRVSQR